jgi:hypothetical protein
MMIILISVILLEFGQYLGGGSPKVVIILYSGSNFIYFVYKTLHQVCILNENQ